MPKNRKPGWNYIYSQELKMEIALNEKTGWVFCEDGVRYSPREIELMAVKKIDITLAVHLAKKEFEGEIFDIEENLSIPPGKTRAALVAAQPESDGKDIF